MNSSKFLIVALLVAMIPALAVAYDFKEGGLCYNVNPDGKSVTMTYEHLILFALDAPMPSDRGYAGDIVIPEKVTHEGKTYTVTAIGKDAFSCNIDLRNVAIPKTVKKIGQGAFMNCGLSEPIAILKLLLFPTR